ncbi:serine/threonine-protein kinase prk-2-like [Syngnathoides biaculeatus]|uniref:serine/threonine-protein kinase prk-2-like n=1 Tax=Syngnathoides biaculeatus TaxID=300417 RepID=UPI002ADDAD47|nr:serine/threonine-protein kinase prk-2-like [Syngnathoides biaculeatus]
MENNPQEKIQQKYETLSLIQKGANGKVYGGIRKMDGFMVLLMQQSGQMKGIISLYDWYSLDQEIVLVLERPVPCMDLFEFIHGIGQMDEAQAKVCFTTATITLRGTLECLINVVCFWNVGGKRECPEKTHADTGRTCKLHTGIAGIEPWTSEVKDRL